LIFRAGNPTIFQTRSKIQEEEMGILALVGRILYSAIFIMSGIGHLTQSKMMAGYAKSKGIPAAELMVIASGLVELVGALLIVLGFHARIGACLIVLFLVPVTFMMHNFWTLKDPMAKIHDQAMFNKNIALLGAALLIIHFGAGPFSLRH
jgi:putative oxidoreductase